MNAETTIEFYTKVVGPAFAYRREILTKRFGKNMADEWGLVLCDAFTGNFSESHGADLRRSEYLRSQRIVPPLLQPGGWSARGQPCDAVHATYRKYMSAYAEYLMGFRGPLFERALEVPLRSSTLAFMVLSYRLSYSPR